MSEAYPRIRLFGPVTRSSRTFETGTVESVEYTLLVKELFRVVFFLLHDHFDIATGVSHALDTYLHAVEGHPEACVEYICRGWQSFSLGEQGWENIRATLSPKARTFFEDYSKHEARLAEKEGASPNIIILGAPGSGYCFDYRARLPFRQAPSDYVSVLSATFPTGFLAEQGPEALREWVLGMADRLPFASAHAGVALDIAPACVECPPALRAVMARHPGFDLRNATIRDFMGARVDGVHWLNFLGPPVLGKLGGADGLHEQLRSPATSVQECGDGRALVTLGPRPDAGDLLQGRTLPEHRELARVLEPWLEPFDPGFLSCAGPTRDEEALRQWWRRFLD